jgi:DNA polymerase-3 subunit alpha
MDGFVHLHVHSHYSLLDGGNRISDLIKTTAAQGSSAIALTDHGNLFGAIDFYAAATKAGIKPILGIEAYISPTTRHDRSTGNQRAAARHLLLLAMNDTGWHNLMKLSSQAYLEGFYYRPRIDRELLSELNEGLICSTACLSGQVPAALLSNQPKRAHKIAAEYRDIFGPDRLFIEIQNQGLADQDRINPALAALAKDLGVGLVGTNDVHFLTRQDKPAHEVLTCISTGTTLEQGGALEYPPGMYLKSPSEMRDALRAWPEAADNTLKIAEMCNLKLDFKTKYLPVFQTPDGQPPDEYLQQQARAGLQARFDGQEVPEDYKQRLERELKVIKDKGYSSYFLIVHDFVQYARSNNIPCSARGSGVATLLGYALGIADVDPLQYGLLFERFTDPQRKEDPDFDIDICQEGRSDLIQYVRRKYGHVAQIITYGTLKAKAAVRDVGRVLNIPLPEVDKIAKLIPDQLGITLKRAVESEPDLARLCQQDQRVAQIIDYGRRLEGLARHAGVHAAGVIVAQIPLEQVVPLYKQADSDDVITQWDGPTCEKVGLMKMDFLGLRTFTILKRARELVRARTGKDIDPEKLPLDDPEVFELFRSGYTDGIFQFESDGMKGVLRQMQPERIDDLIAANAMYRPGPMELIPTYCSRKSGAEEIPSVHPLVDDILLETYGIMAYQEQVMQVLNRLGKLPLNRALSGIKAISKKRGKALAAERPNFIDGAKENGISEQDASRLFDLILEFAGYGFNKAHATRYAIVAYQAAYFKVHHPREFLAATLTFESDDTDKVVQYMAEATRMGIKIAPPDINTCDNDFTVDGQSVRFGLAAVKGVGHKAVEAILTARKEVNHFENLYHFCEYVDLRVANRATIEALIKCGAFDSLGAHRAAMTAALDHTIDLGQAATVNRKSGQMNFFDAFSTGQNKPAAARFPNVEPWSEAQLLAAEKETLGFYITSHPLVRYGRELTSLTTPQDFSLGQAEQVAQGASVTIGCLVAAVRQTTTKRGDKMAMATLEDLTGKCDAVVFPRTYEKVSEHLQTDKLVFLTGTADRRNERIQIIVDEIIPIDSAVEELTGSVLLRLPPGGLNQTLLNHLGRILSNHRGNCPVFFELRPSAPGDALVTIRGNKRWSLQPSRSLADKLAVLLGQENLLLRPKRISARNGASRRKYARKPKPETPPAVASQTTPQFN